jgi:hypothetical protein
MGLFSRKKKDDEDTAEQDALAAEDTGEPAESAEAAPGAQATAVRETVAEPSADDDIPGPPPEHRSRLGDGDEPEVEKPDAGKTEPEVHTPPPAPAAQPAPQTSDPSRSDGPGQSPLEAHEVAVAARGAMEDKPELAVAGAFLGGIVVAQLIRWIGGGGDD